VKIQKGKISMKRKTMVLCAALVASTAIVAVAAPASAMQLTHPTGTKLATGGKLLFTNVGNVLLRSGSGETLQECTSLKLTGTLQHNGSDDITAEVSSMTYVGTGVASRCTGINRTMQTTTSVEEAGKQVGLPYCLTTTAGTDKWAMRGGSCSSPTRSIKIKFHFYGPPDPETGVETFLGTCGYEKANLTGTFTTDTVGGQDAQLTTSGEGAFKRYELSSIFVAQSCPEETKLFTTLTMETDTGPTADPLYIS
jgi:hypothetical protein